jgi:Arc/MetJ family transcription regulator
MAAPVRPKKKPGVIKRGPGRPPRGWTRTNVRIDRTKLESARRILGLLTATETIDAALDAITFRQELIQGIDQLRAAGGLIADPED